MQNNTTHVFTIRPRTPKLKNDWVTILLKILLIGGIYFSLIFVGKRNFNLLFAYIIDPSYGSTFAQMSGISFSEIFSLFDDAMLVASFKYIAPLFLAGLYFLFYTLYCKFFAYLTFNQYLVIGVDFNIRKFRICLDGSFLLLTYGLGICGLIFNFYPLAYNLGAAVSGIALAIIAMALFFLTFSRGLEKKYYPILFNIMLLPTIGLLLFV